MIGKLKKLKELSLFEWKCLVYAYFLLPVTGLLLSTRGYNKTMTMLGLDRAVTGNNSPDKEYKSIIHSIVKMVTIASRYGIYHPACLQKSIVTCWLLHRHNVHAEIRFGVHQEPVNALDAHAWVEYAGINLTDDESLQQQVSPFQSTSQR